MHNRSMAPLALAAVFVLHSWPAAAAGQDSASLVDFSLEQLSDIVVSSVSRQEIRLAEAPASLFLISAADIRRSGATTLPEALRLAPNLQVARSDARSYAVTARGFSSTLENKLLVMIDGRSVYSPLFSGVYWDAQDVLMEDVERIEVISGPGATIWGANAVNGVINIITRASSETQGTLLTASGGTQGRSGSLRHGGALAGGHYRVYAKVGQVADTDFQAGNGASDGWRRSQAGFRADWSGLRHTLAVSGDVYDGRLGQLSGTDVEVTGANLLARVNLKLDDGSELRLQGYVDHTEREQAGVGGQHLDTADLELQHGTHLGAAHQLAWGGGYRYSLDRVRNGPLLRFTPAERALHWANVFAQDEIALQPDLRLTLGLKAEQNDYSGVEWLPNLRLAWNASPASLVWSALSRTVRAPSRIDRDLFVLDARNSQPGAARYLVGGGPDFAAETAHVFELGYRAQPSADLSYAATLFYSDYDKLRTLEPVAGGPALFRNLGRGSAHGLETWARWQAARSWHLAAGLVLQDIRTSLKQGSMDASGSAGLATNDPSHYWSLRSSHDLTQALQATLALRYVGSLPQPAVPAYYELDAHLAWQLQPGMVVSLTGRNLLHPNHPEFGPAATRKVVPRDVALQLASRF